MQFDRAVKEVPTTKGHLPSFGISLLYPVASHVQGGIPNKCYLNHGGT